MSPKVSEEHMEDRRIQILDAAIASFSRKGFHQTTIEDIRLESGLSRGAVYHYFKSKEDIIDAIRERSSGQADDILEEVLVEENATNRLLDIVDAAFSNMVLPNSTDANRLAIFLWAESLVNQRIMDGQLPSFKPFLDIMAQSIREAQLEGVVYPDIDPEGAARAIAGAMMGLQLQLTWEPDMDMKKAWDVLVSMLTGNYWQGTPLEQGSSSEAHRVS